MKNFNSLRCLVLEISVFEFDDYAGFRAGAGVRKLFLSDVSETRTKRTCGWVAD